MNIKTYKQLFQEAIANGCITAADLAHFLRVRALAAKSFQRL